MVMSEGLVEAKHLLLLKCTAAGVKQMPFLFFQEDAAKIFIKQITS